ncbi:hypothetical protein GTO91_14565, partial [Heliobacterium undosum]
ATPFGKEEEAEVLAALSSEECEVEAVAMPFAEEKETEVLAALSSEEREIEVVAMPFAEEKEAEALAALSLEVPEIEAVEMPSSEEQEAEAITLTVSVELEEQVDSQPAADLEKEARNIKDTGEVNETDEIEICLSDTDTETDLGVIEELNVTLTEEMLEAGFEEIVENSPEEDCFDSPAETLSLTEQAACVAVPSPAGQPVPDLGRLMDDAFRHKTRGDFWGALEIFQQATRSGISMEDEMFIVLEMCAIYELMDKHDEAYHQITRYWEKHRGDLPAPILAEIENYLKTYRAPRTAADRNVTRRTAV